MTISNLKDLEALLKLCRKHGVDDISVDGMRLRIGGQPTARQVKSDDSNVTPELDWSTDDLLFWSSSPADEG